MASTAPRCSSAPARCSTAATHLEGIGAAAPTEVSRDGTIAVSRLSLTERPDSVPVTTGKSLISLSKAASQDGLRVEMGGQVITNAQESALSSEAVGLMIAALVLVLTFGTLVAAGLPIVTALFGLGISSALVGLLAAVMDVPDWSTAVASMIGLGVGIDYALLILTRHRAALAARARAARSGRRGGLDRRALGARRRHDRRHLAARACS